MFVRGSGRPCCVSSDEEGVLEVAERDVGAERAAQLRDARLVRVARDAGLDVGRRRAVVDPGLVAGARELGGREAWRDVEQHARDRRDRDPVADRRRRSGCRRPTRWMTMPGRRRWAVVGTVISGGGGRFATRHLEHVRARARARASRRRRRRAPRRCSRRASTAPRGRPRRRRSALPAGGRRPSQRLIRSASIPAASSWRRVTRPCCRRASSAAMANSRPHTGY